MDWSDFEKNLTTSARDIDAAIMGAGTDDAKLASLHVKVSEAMELMKAHLTFIEAKLAENVNVQIGDHVRDVGDKRITVSWPEKYEWDMDKVADIVGGPQAVPYAFVKEELKIDKRAFDKASPQEQSVFIPALTRKPGSRKVKVEVIG